MEYKVKGKLYIYEKGDLPKHYTFHYGPLEKAEFGFKHIFIIIHAFTNHHIIQYYILATKDVIACFKKLSFIILVFAAAMDKRVSEIHSVQAIVRKYICQFSLNNNTLH